MAAEQHDLIVVGGGLSEHIAATLLARQGYRVLQLTSASFGGAEPLPCCPVLEKLLTSLDGKHLTRQRSDSFQLITDNVRLELCGPLPLAEELAREFPDHHAAILALLARLDDWGKRLGLLLASAAPDSLWGPIRMLSLYRRLLRHKLPARRLRQPVIRLLETLPAEELQQSLTQLLAGMCLSAPQRLSVAEAALKWHTATRPEQIVFQDLIDLLTERFSKAGGQSVPLSGLKEKQWHGKRLQSITFHDGRCLTARQFLLAPLPEGLEVSTTMASALPAAPEPPRWSIFGPGMQRPPMLARQAILGGNPPLRLTWSMGNCSTNHAIIEPACAAGQSIPSKESVQRRLASLLPFCDFQMNEANCPAAPVAFPGSLWPSGVLPRPIGSNALFCHGPSLLPSAGESADLILGQAAAGVLQQRLG